MEEASGCGAAAAAAAAWARRRRRKRKRKRKSRRRRHLRRRTAAKLFGVFEGSSFAMNFPWVGPSRARIVAFFHLSCFLRSANNFKFCLGVDSRAGERLRIGSAGVQNRMESKVVTEMKKNTVVNSALSRGSPSLQRANAASAPNRWADRRTALCLNPEKGELGCYPFGVRTKSNELREE